MNRIGDSLGRYYGVVPVNMLSGTLFAKSTYYATPLYLMMLRSIILIVQEYLGKCKSW